MTAQAAAAPRAARARASDGVGAGERGLGLVLVAPVALLMGALVFVPLGLTLWDSLHRIDPMRAGTPFIGLRHYADLVADKAVRQAWLNTVAYVAIAVTLETLGGLGAALLLNRVRVARRWLLAAVILPWALPPVVNAIVWLWIYNPSYGLLDAALLRLHVIDAPRVWFNDRTTALLLVSLVHVWRMMPLTAVILAEIMDDAIALSQSTVFAFNLFDEAWILAGSSLDTRTVVAQVYMSAFQNLHFSYGMALSVLVMVASCLVSLVYVLRVYRETRYE